MPRHPMQQGMRSHLAHRDGAASVGPSGVRVLLAWGPPSAGLAVALIGGVYLTAWLVGLAARWSASGVLTMKANMAGSLVLSGWALVLLEPRRATPARRAVGRALAAAVVLVGGLTLLEHVFHADFGLDQLLATEPPGAFATTGPNRPGPPGALSLMLVGGGLLALASRWRVASFFGLATAAIVLVPAVGFVSGVVPLYGTALSGIAWPTVVAFVLLAAGLHMAEGPDGPLGLVWRQGPGSRLVRGVIPAAVFGTLVIQALQRLGSRRGWYSHEFGVSALLISVIGFMCALLWRTALRLNAEAARGRAVREEARRRANLLDLVRDAIVVWSLERGVEGWYRGAEELYRFTSSEALGRNPHALLQTEGPCPMSEIEAELRATGRWEGELRSRTKDGHEVVVSSKWRLVRSRDGRERVLEVNRDITARKEMENELRESGRRKDEFLNLLSHELRNPLAPIRNSLYILEHADPAAPQARRAVEVVGRQVGHLTRLVDDLLEVTRITRGKVQLRRARLDLGGLARRTGEDYGDVFEKRGVEFAMQIPDEAVWVDGDDTRLAQVMGNLLHNAAKFTPAGGQVTLSVRAVEGRAEVRVVDTGIGIEPALLLHVFEPFVQAEQSLARTQGGLGLGLALVKGLVALHGGSVEARSGRQGVGTEFVVQLPIASGPERRDAGDAGPRRAHQALRVLVVEDNLDSADTLAELVRMHGHEVEVAHDGPTAVAKATAAVPDLVLCDIGLPGMSGYEVARALRRNPTLHGTRLVAVTGYANPEDVQRATDAGFSGHIAKPADPSVLEPYLTT